jgi:hypothetical protein
MDLKTKKQEALIYSFLAGLSEEQEPLYREIILYLSELGYNPRKEGQSISFKHSQHSKQIAKIGWTRGKMPSPVFKLRFSACRDYSQKFLEVVKRAAVTTRDNAHGNVSGGCLNGECHFCAGEPETHLYKHTAPDGTVTYACGAQALAIPNITAEDAAEIKRLLKEEHFYLMKHQAGITLE